MTGPGGAVPAPLILDFSVVAAIARGNPAVMSLIQVFDAGGQPLVVPVLAIVAALTAVPGEDAEALLHGLELLGNTATAPLADADQAAQLAAVIAATGLDPADAHVAAVADLLVGPILTLTGDKWRQHAAGVGEQLYFIEIFDPGENR